MKTTAQTRNPRFMVITCDRKTGVIKHHDLGCIPVAGRYMAQQSFLMRCRFKGLPVKVVLNCIDAYLDGKSVILTYVDIIDG